MVDFELKQPILPLGGITIRASSIDPLNYLKIINEKDFEDIVGEWAYEYVRKGAKDIKIRKLGGPGDKGRDIAVYKEDGSWINYQCKHYKEKIGKSDFLLEVGKIIYYCFTGEITPPSKSYIFGPQGVSNTTNDLILNKQKLKTELIQSWDKSCRRKISSKEIPLDEKLKSFLTQFDYDLFDTLDPQEFIEQYKETPYFTSRFGILSKPRPLPQKPPLEIKSEEITYIKKILEAYSDYLHKHLNSLKELEKHPDLKKDFENQRRYFYAAESLKQFSRDIDPGLEQFNGLKEDIYEGILEKVQEDCNNGFERLRKVLTQASLVNTRQTLVAGFAQNSDKKGVCHHLANEREDIKWKI